MIGDNRVMDREIRGSQFILPSNNEIKSIIILVCWNFDVLGQIKSIEEIKKIKSSAIVTVINSEISLEKRPSILEMKKIPQKIGTKLDH